MRRRLGDGFLLLVLLPGWLLCFALTARDVIAGTAYTAINVDCRTSQRYPVVVDAGPEGGLGAAFRVGDRVLRWGGAWLWDVDQDRFTAAVERNTPASGQVLVDVARHGRELRLTAATGSYRTCWPRLASALVFFVAALILNFSAPRTELTRSFVRMLFGGALLFVCTFSGAGWLVRLADVAQVIGLSTLSVFMLRGFLLFPHGELPHSRWLRALPWCFAVTGPLDLERSVPRLLPASVSYYGALSLSVLEIVLICAILLRAYLRASALERRMLKWMLWGVYVALFLPLALALTAMVVPALAHAFYIAVASLAVIPLALLLAIFRFNLFDVNRVLTLTALCSIAFCVVLVSALAGLPALAVAATGALGLPAEITWLVLSATLIGGVLLGYRALRPQLDRVLFGGGAALQERARSLSEQITAARSPTDAIGVFTNGLNDALHPMKLAAYVGGEPAWDNVLAIGTAIAPALRCDSELLRLASARAGIINLEPGQVRPLRIDSAYDRALVAALDVALIVPMHRAGRLVGVLCVGRKASGDVYVSSELVLLEALADVLGQRLACFELEHIAADAHALRDALRRYVPGAIAQAIEHGDRLDARECEATLMFVDIRGYSGYAEGRPVSEVFAVLNDYTRRVSGIVIEHGGQIVEFNGDGMMAIFGAPSALAAKERGAVQAALAIHKGLSSRRVGREAAPLRVGIGVATGPAFVGSIRAVDRWIWTAIGETTNRAARLQSLTRDFAASIILDETTWRMLGNADYGFVAHRDQRLRGLQQRHTVFARPLDDRMPAMVSLPA